MKQLEGLRWRKCSTERLGCVKGCLEYLGSNISFPWLYGGTGYAFIISLDPGVDVSSPDSWDHRPQFALGRNLGYDIDGFSVWGPDVGDVFAARQREAWDFVRTSIDRGVPCFGFELQKYYGGYWVIYGYDDIGYYYSGWVEGGPLPWQELGAQFIPLLEVHSVQRCEPAPVHKIIKDGLAYALKHAQNPSEWIQPQARSGPAAWAYWAEALETGAAKRDHHAYNLALWLECREMAVAFLQEVRAHLPARCDALCAEAVERYGVVCETLRRLHAMHPIREPADWGPDSTFTSTEAAALIRQVADAEAQGMAYLQQIVAAI